MCKYADRAEGVLSDAGLQRWQINEIEEGLREADAGDFASDEEVVTVFAKWTQGPSSS